MPTPAPAMPPLPQDVEQFLTWMNDQKGFSPATISAYRTDLLQFEEWLHREQHSLARPGELEKYHFQDYSAHLFHEGQARSSIGRKLSALRSLFRYLMKMKKIDKNPAKLVRNPKRELRHPTALNVDQMFTLLDEATDGKANYLKDGQECRVLLYNEKPLDIEIPASLVLEVTETEPGAKGDTVSNVTKPATLETGVVIQVPIFVNIGDRVKVDTRTNGYLGRE